MSLRQKLLIRLTPMVNFTNILRAAFRRADPKSAIKLHELTVFFALLGSACVKAAYRMLMKLTPGGKGGKRKRRRKQERNSTLILNWPQRKKITIEEKNMSKNVIFMSSIFRKSWQIHYCKIVSNHLNLSPSVFVKRSILMLE